MGSENLKKAGAISSPEDYKAVACLLNKAYPDIHDVMVLRRNALLDMISDLPNFKTCRRALDSYALDDIRFEWFFLKKGTGEDRRSSQRLRSKF